MVLLGKKIFFTLSRIFIVFAKKKKKHFNVEFLNKNFTLKFLESRFDLVGIPDQVWNFQFLMSKLKCVGHN